MTLDFATSQTAFVEALLYADRAVPDGIITASGVPDATRFGVYRNNVFLGLTKALTQNFPVTERLVGTEFFTVMARFYAQDHRPASPLIFEYGADFPDFIASFEPVANLGYLPDVARIEAAAMRAYHAADTEPLDLAKLAALAPERLADLRLAVHSSSSLIHSGYPVGSIWSAHQQQIVTPVVGKRPETVLVGRPEMTVNVHIIPPKDAIFAASLFNAATLGAAADAALAAAPEFDFGTALIGLVSLGAFSALLQDEGNVP